MDLTPFLSEPLILLVLGFLALGPIATVARRVPLAFKLSAGVLRYAALVLALPDRLFCRKRMQTTLAEYRDLREKIDSERGALQEATATLTASCNTLKHVHECKRQAEQEMAGKHELLQAFETLGRHYGCPAQDRG